MNYAIVGTAGHVDHGKTELTRALTGVQTDRLKEEQQRGISIKLGFAPLTLPNGQKVGLVDVPGHEKFIKQMLAGAAGMDLVLLIVGADEGVMPQTREHLEILRLLQIRDVIVVVTKKDLVDEEWLELVTEDIREYLEATPYASAPLMAVSAYTGDGIDELKKVLMDTLENIDGKSGGGKPRLPVDRVFSITGFGTVVTGTLWSGQIHRGDSLMILPRGTKTRVRNIQVHGANVDTAYAGQRVALNITDVETGQIPHGSVIVPEGTLSSAYRIDMEFLLLPGKKKMGNRERVRVHVGTSEVLGRLILLDREELEPGQSALVQVLLENPLVAARRDRAVLRSYSPMVTIGGGTILDPNPDKHRRFDNAVLERLRTRLTGGPDDLILQALGGISALTPRDLSGKTGLTEEETNRWVASMEEQNEVRSIGGHIVSAEGVSQWKNQVMNSIEKFQVTYPLRRGMSREELRSKHFSGVPSRFFQGFLEMLTREELLDVEGSFVFVRGFTPVPSPEQNKEIRDVLERFESGGFTPPEPEELREQLGVQTGEYILYLLGRGELVKINEQILFSRNAYQQAVTRILQFLEEQGELKLADARDLLDSSRKYVLPLLEHLDSLRVTSRNGDVRLEGPRAAGAREAGGGILNAGGNGDNGQEG